MECEVFRYGWPSVTSGVKNCHIIPSVGASSSSVESFRLLGRPEVPEVSII